ncbi:MAG: dynamin family protein [Campylobacterota bacterium]|nr:dynamin family protein [Campylobacterota bacterium]
MNTDKQQYKDIQSKLINLSKDYMSEQEIEKFNLHIDKKLDNFESTIMVYGTYNAGKSTLLNAIFGKEEMAKTGDAPETSEISEYTYNGYTIYDTPGINAPQEHQEVTDNHLKKCELILFVLNSDGSFEDRYIYEKISEIVQLNKPILIVVNNKSGIEKNSLDEKQLIDKINKNLNKVGDEKGIEKIETKVNICMVHAKTALKAKLKNSNLLLENSNIIQLQNEIEILLASAGHNEVVNALNNFIGEFIGEVLTNIDKEIDNPEMKKTQELITYLEKMKQRVEIELKNIVIEGVTILSANLLELMLGNDKNSIEAMIKKTTDEIMKRINYKFKQIHEELNNKIDEFRVDFEALIVDSENIDTSDSNTDKVTASAPNADSSKQLISATTKVAAAVIPKIPMLAPLAPLLGPIGIVVGLISALFGGSDEARRQAEAELDAKRQQRLSAKNKTDEYTINYKNNLLQSIDTNLDKTFTKLIYDFVELASKLDGENSKLLQDKEKLQNILKNL